MGFSVQIPVPGQPFSTEGVKVGNDIAAIASWGNGHILGADLDPAAGIQASQLDPSIALVPTGTVLQFAGKAAIPAGFAACNGQTLNQASYPRGYAFATAEAAAGNPLWTVNAGANAFTVPNLLNRFVWFDATAGVGTSGGEQSHTLTLAEMPSHDHAVSSVRVVAAGGGVSGVLGGAAGDQGPLGTVQGSNGAHNNMPPYVVLALIVKV